MTKKILAQKLRHRQRDLNLMDVASKIDKLSDDVIIKSYVTCCGCGVQSVSGKALDDIIEQSKSVEDFLDLTEIRCH